ncbi:MAG TPA: beta-N-acetylglucosaminidase domain-containing protein [Parvibaculum sp.]
MAELGIIEGYYGAPWGAAERRETMTFLKGAGYSFYLYAPKADAFLRRRWQEDHPAAEAGMLASFSAAARAAGVRFGVGLSPYEIYRDFGSAPKAALRRKLEWLDALGLDDLAICFDDMKGSQPDLAEAQARVIDFAAAHTRATRLIVCPSYYTDDPILDLLFGARPPRYLEDLGRLLDPSIEIFWTGEEVCAREFSTGHLARVGEQLRRKPFIWDNYPVNDGPRMSPHLHLRAFSGRPAAMAAHVAAHGVNPALQPVLSRIPALTLAESYASGDAYEYGAAFMRAAEKVLGADLAQIVRHDLIALQDAGLDKLGARAAKIRARYAALDHPGAREIVRWLDGEWRITQEEMEAQ